MHSDWALPQPRWMHSTVAASSSEWPPWIVGPHVPMCLLFSRRELQRLVYAVVCSRIFAYFFLQGRELRTRRPNSAGCSVAEPMSSPGVWRTAWSLWACAVGPHKTKFQLTFIETASGSNVCHIYGVPSLHVHRDELNIINPHALQKRAPDLPFKPLRPA